MNWKKLPKQYIKPNQVKLGLLHAVVQKRIAEKDKGHCRRPQTTAVEDVCAHLTRL